MLYIVIAEQMGLAISDINMAKHFIIGFEHENEINGESVNFILTLLAKVKY